MHIFCFELNDLGLSLRPVTTYLKNFSLDDLQTAQQAEVKSDSEHFLHGKKTSVFWKC